MRVCKVTWAILVGMCLSSLVGNTQVQVVRPEARASKTQTLAGASHSLPHLQTTGTVKQLVVDNKPYIILGGELRNSSASSIDYMRPVWDNLMALHLNTVISTVSWELLEPEEGHFDFSLVDSQIQEARKRNLRLVLIFFGSWKNGNSTYVPLWVKTDHQRFPVQRFKGDTGFVKFVRGQRDVPLSPFSDSTMKADAKAFRALIRHIRQVDEGGYRGMNPMQWVGDGTILSMLKYHLYQVPK